MQKLIWVGNKILELLCRKVALIKASCAFCNESKPCGNVPDIGFVCLKCQERNHY